MDEEDTCSRGVARAVGTVLRLPPSLRTILHAASHLPPVFSSHSARAISFSARHVESHYTDFI